ncbi:RNA pseudouridylate synthase [Fragilaria crotonensis]|nr:RNA pseudouridylate synthase [Fragilaria crotonensis]
MMLVHRLVRLPRASAAFASSSVFAPLQSQQHQHGNQHQQQHQGQVFMLQRCGLAGMSRHMKTPMKSRPRISPLIPLLPSIPTSMRVYKGDNNGSRSSRTATAGNSEKSKDGPKKITNRPHQLRADRVLANRGWGSRSECFDVLKQKRVKVLRDGQYYILQGPSERLDMNEAIWVDHKELPQIPLLLVYHKPKWVLSVMNDPKGRPCLASVLPKQYQSQDLHPVGLHGLGTGVVDETQLSETLARGVETTEGTHTAELVDVQHLTQEDSQQVWQRVRDTLPPEYDVEELEERRFLPDSTTTTSDGTTTTSTSLILSQVRLVVTEGKHRMVRRMLANCGHGVVELKREKQGVVELGDLPENEFRRLTPDEQEWAQSMVPSNARKKNKK